MIMKQNIGRFAIIDSQMFENQKEGEAQLLNPSKIKGSKDAKAKPTVAPLQSSPPNTEKRAIRKLGQYQFSMDQRVGSGMTGDAYVGINTQNRELVCIKIVDRAVFKSPEQQKLLQNEIRCQQLCRSSETIAIYDIFDTNSFCFIVTEFCEGGDLYRFLRKTANGMSEQLVVHFGKQIAQALKKLKEAKIVHRDIKSQNILIQKHHCKLGDFGFALEEKKLQSQKRFNLGSPLYMSIQSLESSQYSYASDVFSFGVVLYEMLHRQSPWECTDEKELLSKMKSEEVAFKSGVSEDMKRLIAKCLSKQPQERATIEQVLQHPAFRQNA